MSAAIDPRWAAAEPAALHAAAGKVAAGGHALPSPSLRDYVVDVGRAFAGAIAEWIGRALPWTDLGIAEQVLVWTAAGAALLIVVLLVLLAVRRWRRRSGDRPRVAATVTPASGAALARDAVAWRDELRRRLDAGALRGALHAAWWWAARSLDPPGLDPSWTTGELLRARSDAAVRQPLRRVDRLLWGVAEPGRDEVESAVGELDRALAARGDANGSVVRGGAHS